jgi:chromosome segregation ATPase
MELRQLRDQRGIAMEKLRAQVKDLEADLTGKVGEIKRLKERLAAVEQENSKLKAERNRRKDQQQQQQQQQLVDVSASDELRRLRSDLLLVEAERDQLRGELERKDAAAAAAGGKTAYGEEERIRQLETVVGRLQEQLQACQAAAARKAEHGKWL